MKSVWGVLIWLFAFGGIWRGVYGWDAGAGGAGNSGGVVPVVLVQYNACANSAAVEQAAMSAGLVYYVGETNCHFIPPPGTEIVLKDVRSYTSPDGERVEDVYPRTGQNDLLRAFEIKCIQRHFVLRDVMNELGIDRVAYIDHDVMLYVNPAGIYRKLEQQGLSPEIVLTTSSEVVAAAYTSIWSRRGISAMCAFMSAALSRNPSVDFNDMQLTSAYYGVFHGDALIYDLSTAVAPYEAVLLGDHPNRMIATPLEENGLAVVFEPRVDRNESTMLLLPPQPHPFHPSELVRLRRIFYCDRTPLVFDTRTRQFLVEGILHFRGRQKDVMPFYASWKHRNCVCEDVTCASCTPLVQFGEQERDDADLVARLQAACPTAFGADTDEEDGLDSLDDELY